MKKLYEDVKSFLLDAGNKAFKEKGLAAVPESAIIFGAINPVKNTQNVIISVYPESLETTETYLGGSAEQFTVTLTIACRNKPYETLMADLCAYAETCRSLFVNDSTLGGRRSDITVGKTTFFPDCGIAGQSMTGAELELTIISDSNHKDALSEEVSDLFV